MSDRPGLTEGDVARGKRLIAAATARERLSKAGARGRPSLTTEQRASKVLRRRFSHVAEVLAWLAEDLDEILGDDAATITVGELLDLERTS